MSLPNTLAIQDIIRFCALALPALDGDTRPSETEADSREAEIMASAFGRLSVAHPEAGAVYWACRTWLLWMWQPVYLGVWAASVKGASPDFSGFAHTFDGLFTARFGIAVQDCTVRLRQEAVSRTATDLKAYLYASLPLIRPHYPLGAKLAEYFLGDAVLKLCLPHMPCACSRAVKRKCWRGNGRMLWRYAATARWCGTGKHRGFRHNWPPAANTTVGKTGNFAAVVRKRGLRAGRFRVKTSRHQRLLKMQPADLS